MARDENMDIVPLLAVEWSQNVEGLTIKTHPKAACQNGEPMDAESLKNNIEGLIGNIEGFSGMLNAARLSTFVDSSGYEILGDRELFVKTQSVDPASWSLMHGANYHLTWFGPANYILEQGHDGYIENPVGCGPYELTEYKPGDSAKFTRWEDFWGDYEHYSKPQAQTMDWIKVPEAATRFALLKTEDVDMALNLPYAIAKNITRSEDSQPGVNPGNGEMWTKTLGANGKMQVAFGLQHAIVELGDDGTPKADPAKWGNDPTLNGKVREALALAIDKQAIHDTGFGFLLANQSICSKGSFGWRESQDFVSEYNPEKAKQLLAEAGYADGFTTEAHFGEFAGRPNQKEAMDIIASNWKDIGVTISVTEHDPFTYYSSGDSGVREFQPVNEWTWGRQEHCAFLTGLAHSENGIRNIYNDETTALDKELTNTLDEAKQLELMAKIDDIVLANHWTIPLYDASVVYGYTDRVLEHKQPPYGAHFMAIHRIVLRD
jgi:peptide/nickel transport system substrate-binding protein